MTFFSDIWKSFLGLPMWVRIWIFLILVPINVASLWFIGQPGSVLIASIAIAGIAFNAIPLWFERGFSHTMAIPHVIFWVPLVIILITYLTGSKIILSDEYRYFLVTLLTCNLISLAFDIPDAFRWFRDRKRSPKI